MPSPQHEAIVKLLTSRPVPETPPTVEESRAGFEQMVTTLIRTPEDVESEPLTVAGRPAAWVSAPGARPDSAILYLHGGGYVLGSIDTHRELVSRLSRASGARGLLLDYRLAPEHPFPAAVDDATAAYRFLLSSGIDPRRIAIAGDSAGGGLTLATLLALRDAGDPLPAAGVCMSAWTDLEGLGASAQPGAIDDPLLQLAGLREMASRYAAQALRNPLASPVHGSYRGLPPLLLQVGTREILLDDSTRVADRARAAGVEVTLEKWDGLIHVWQLFGSEIPESQQAVQAIGDFLRKRLQ